jgi:hypothetical protein
MTEMSHAVTIVNPAAEDVAARLAPAPRVASLRGARVALIDNSKHNADRFLDTLAALLVRDHGVARIERYRKVSASVPTPPETLARLLAASDAAREPMGYPRPAINQPDTDATLAAVRAALGEAGFTSAWAEGRAMPLEQAIALALEGPATAQPAGSAGRVGVTGDCRG